MSVRLCKQQLEIELVTRLRLLRFVPPPKQHPPPSTLILAGRPSPCLFLPSYAFQIPIVLVHVKSNAPFCMTRSSCLHLVPRARSISAHPTPTSVCHLLLLPRPNLHKGNRSPQLQLQLQTLGSPPGVTQECCCPQKSLRPTTLLVSESPVVEITFLSLVQLRWTVAA